MIIVKHLIRISLLLLCAVMVNSCHDDKVNQAELYGYVQFRLQKAATRGTTLEQMADAAKIEVMLRNDGSTITQTLNLESYDAESAEYGLRSETLQLLASDYSLMGFYIYNAMNEKIYSGAPQEPDFTVIPGGLETKNIMVDATPHGVVSFELVKNLIETRASEPAAYLFQDIKRLDLMLKNSSTSEVVTVKDILVTAQATSDTLVWLKGGTYEITSYTTYSTKSGSSGQLETASLSGLHVTFEVKDNQETRVQVPIRLSTTAEHIKDYRALHELWEALDGPNWCYHGDEYTDGINWDFNKDLDTWGNQPGVTLNGNGRVTALCIAGFGASGVVPDCIGQLTKLVILSLGTHDECINGRLFSVLDANNLSQARLKTVRHDYENRFLKRDIRNAMSSILVEAVNRGDIQQPKIERDARITLKDNNFGVLTNHITGISRALMRCTELQQFYLANSPITADGFFRDIQPSSSFYSERNSLSWSKMTMLTDLELYNLPKLTRLPQELFAEDGLPEVQLLNIAVNKAISATQIKKDTEMICKSPFAPKLQILYAGFNNLEETPDYSHLHRLSKLALLDWTNNKISTLHPFGKDINLNTVYLDYNQITSIPTDADGYFFGYYDTESFYMSHNLLTEVPDIFNAKSNYYIDQVDFSHNEIKGFEHGDQHRGINAYTINLSQNQLDRFPHELFAAGSPISSLNLMGNLIAEMKKGEMTGPKVMDLQSLDLTYNKLTALSEDFYATNVPYLYGVDVSFNSLDAFPWELLDGTRITVIGCRAQRDEEGNRTLREWPTGIYKSPSMRALYLGGNDIRKVEDTLSPYIYILDIHDNPNISIDVSDVCYYIGAGSYILLHDPEQDIRGCEYVNK